MVEVGIFRMKVFGSAPNLTSWENYGLSILEEAGMDYRKALAGAEIYLGEIFGDAACGPRPWQIFDLEIDECRRRGGEKAVSRHIYELFFARLGHYIQYRFLPPDSSKWRELEDWLRRELYVAMYNSPHVNQLPVSVRGLAAVLFEYAVKGQEEIVVEGQKIKLNPHIWRKWFYGLWGQVYEWGCFRLDEKMAEANEKVYFFPCPPRRSGQEIVINPRPILEAHGFRVSISQQGKVEYWR
jgi:hypothetical protein